MSDELERRMEAEIAHLRSPSAPGRITITPVSSPAEPERPVRPGRTPITIHPTPRTPQAPPGRPVSSPSEAEDYPASVTADPYTDVRPYSLNLPSHPTAAAGPGAERILRIVLWSVTILGLLLIVLNFQAVTLWIFYFLTGLIINVGSVLTVIILLLIVVLYFAARIPRNRGGRW